MRKNYPELYCPSIVQFRKSMEFSPTFVNAERFEKLWRDMNNSLFVSSWEGDPEKTWFSGEKFITGDIRIGINNNKGAIHFNNGRHRTRWMIQFNKKEIVVGINNESFENAIKLGLEPRKIKYD